uniref:Integral membrane protein n=1 Tax=Streptomyces sp. NBC_00003 TaxID=2903608 RepID=A0AAU2V459_9ACTN
MAVQEARQCGGDCAHGARDGHRRAVAEFLAKRDGLAAGEGLPAALAHSAVASRQWVSDELTQSARVVAERGREAGRAWPERVWRGTLATVWGGVFVLCLAEAATAIGAGWTAVRTAGLLSALVAAALLTAAAYFHRARGGLLAPVLGEDNRLSTSRTVAAAWILFAVFAALLLALRLAAASDPADREKVIRGLELARCGGLLTALFLTSLIAVVVSRVVTVRVYGQRLQKVRADRPRGVDLFADDAGRGSFADAQYVVVTLASVLFAAVRLARRPDQLPDLPWGLALLVIISAVTYFAGKHAEGGRPVVLSVVRAREAGDLDAPIRTGEDIEIRGAGFVPPGAGTPDRLARMVVRIGAVYVHVPLIPVPGGFANPTDGVLTVPVPVDVEAGLVEVRVVTAAGAETNAVLVEVSE